MNLLILEESEAGVSSVCRSRTVFASFAFSNTSVALASSRLACGTSGAHGNETPNGFLDAIREMMVACFESLKRRPAFHVEDVWSLLIAGNVPSLVTSTTLDQSFLAR